jgi:hypothetical protein
MAATRPGATVDAGSVPELTFAMQGAAPVAFAAAPTLALALRIDRVAGPAVRSILLDVQVQIAARRRAYGERAQERLPDLFGPVADWASGLHTVLWTRLTHVVHAFADETTVDLLVPCTYDLEVSASRYLDALDDGEVPLELLFSGSVFYAAADGRLQTARLSWEHEAEYRLPVAVWREAMERHFPGCAWVRLDRERYDRLAAYRARHALGRWEEVVDALLPEGAP